MAIESTKKVALVTGASSGIGKAIVTRMLGQGWTVYGAARRVDQMSDIQAAGAHVIQMDVTDEGSMVAGVESILQAEGRIDALVNNAGYGSHGALEVVPIDEARRQFEVNVFGLARLVQLVLPTMRAAGSGTIVNIGSIAGRMWMPFGSWYHATKYSLEAMSDALRVEVRPFGIRVVLVQPGAIRTEWGDIAVNNLVTRTQGTVYEDRARRFSKMLSGAGIAVGPDVIARVVTRAVNSRCPRRRYAAPFHAKMMIFFSWLLPAGVWEFAMRMVLK
ncbi:MAG TPA: oxidoreductase [Myxococcota bacterium]|nr:oxidoreductase [Myxococcota bacterium]HOD07027.1 oxidoreductase [Myxococcota bacterium]HPB49633.1 oxidoreductase [Myxococcota bacterium]HQP94899.1 oxidoreductase [Myxococcota bacterium]